MKLLKYTLLSALLIGTAGTFTACKKDPCKDKTCNNGGTCVDGTCICATGYEGSSCDTRSTPSLYGVYSGTTICVGTPEVSGGLIVSPGILGENSIVIECGYGDLNATLSGNNFTLTFNPSAADITGSGTIDGYTMTWDWVILGEICSFSGTK